MNAYYVEGLFIPKKNLRKVKQGEKIPQSVLEPFARTIWAENPEVALLLADDALEGGEWLEAPRISETSETQRMRALGAPELPGLTSTTVRKRKDKR